MAHLTTVVGSFHARLLVARLASEGIAAELEGSSEGPYPFPVNVDVLVSADELSLAREILLADAVDAVFSDGLSQPRRRPGARRPWLGFRSRS